MGTVEKTIKRLPNVTVVAERTKASEQLRSQMVKSVAVILLEHALLAASLAVLIPPVPSYEGHEYHYNFAVFGAFTLLFSLSKFLAIARRSETLIGAMLKYSILLVFGMVVYTRVAM